MSVRLSAVIKTPNGHLLVLRQDLPDGTHRHLLPGRRVDGTDQPFEDALRRALREQANLTTTIGALVDIDKTGVDDEYVFVAHTDGDNSVSEYFIDRLPPAPNGYSWNCIEPTPTAIHNANFTPKRIGNLLAGHLRHGQQPWALTDIRSRPPTTRRHHKAP
ncbi:NUDIX hydrolase [Amycolatopsis sp. cg5]|uniref:NUDIX hydrolase n=1 Tax=Amycolatopsis sp. cg5 TaxID=3238802 RepID=UPI0035247500